jgi:alkylmercury lyase
MNKERAFEMASKLKSGLLDYGPEHSRLLLRVVRALARGQPLTAEQVNQMIVDLGIAQPEARQFLSQVTERNSDGHIVGAIGLALNGHPHRLSVEGVPLSAWCAEDTLFLLAMLGQTAVITSRSPVTKEEVRLKVSPGRVVEVSPASAVVSIVVVDPRAEDMASVEAIWNSFCDHIHFFASREEAERWSRDRDNIAILTVEEGFELGRQLWSEVLPYAE